MNSQASSKPGEPNSPKPSTALPKAAGMTEWADERAQQAIANLKKAAVRKQARQNQPK